MTFDHASAAGEYALACDQLAPDTLIAGITPRPSSLGKARVICALALRSAASDFDREGRRSLAGTGVLGALIRGGRARVSVQRTLYGLKVRATGTAILEHGRWKIAVPLSEAHVGSSVVARIPTQSMEPTLHVGDTLLYDRAAYRHAEPRIGDIVVFHPPEGAIVGRCGKHPPGGQACAAATPGNSSAKFVKRIVARAGDRVSIRHGHVIRNGRLAIEDFTTPCASGPVDANCDFPRTFTVAAGRYYLLGDNRGDSFDSRDFGPVAAAQILGRVRRLGP